MSEEAPVVAQYLFAANSFMDLVRGLDAAEWETPVPCTPGWTVRDVLSHVSGIPDDALSGRMDGATTDPWTASQVERNRHLTADDLLDRWHEQLPAFTAALAQMSGGLAPFDCHSHEHDVRHALGRPGNRDSMIVEQAGRGLAHIDVPGVRVDIEFADGQVVSSGPDDGGSVTLRGVTPFEMFRSRIGRRSREQVRAAEWIGDDGDVDTVVASWFVFGPAREPIIE